MTNSIARLVLGFALAAAMVGTGMAANRGATAGGGVPTFDVRPSCKTGVDAGIRKDIQGCLDSENNARADLVKRWNDFASADRTLCINAASTGGSATYTELITCLEMLHDAKALKQKEARDNTTNGTGTEGRTKSKR